ncbi:MFS transporter [Cognatilysobacter lacus]|uniref:MFS transporter n=1 Tax=Cognatilysobacter lacus TaxID=1643323 RepID=A0A5D8YXM4_9GAMM|nr:MFS transporter [Lysobacter lacus]TZF87199.1 MFS transporter [Lysobacter lacus]
MIRSNLKRIPPGVWALGWVSLFMDFGSEMVHSLLPLLLAGPLGASALAIGLIEGVAEALVLVTKLLSGYASDALGKRKPVVVLGYGLAALVKPVFPMAQSLSMVVSARLLDRFGKGIRGAPRDALMSDIVPPELRGASFGLRQSMDTVGAVIGPLVAMALMLAFNDDIRRVLWYAVLPSLVSVAILVRFVREPERVGDNAPRARLPITRDGLSALGPAYWRVVAIGALLSLARFSEAFLILRADQLGLAKAYAPLVLVVMSLVYTLSSYPAGALSDRLGRRGVLIAGLAVLVVADLVLALARGPALALVGASLWGLHMGLTQGVLGAFVADYAPKDFRGTAFGVFSLASGVALLIASAVAGALWDWQGAPATFIAGALFATLCGVASFALPRRIR